MKYLRQAWRRRIRARERVRIAFAAVLVFAVCAPPLAANERPFRPGSTRAEGMGNTWIAGSAPEDALFFNPSLLATPVNCFTLLRLRASANGDGLGLLLGQEGRDVKNWGENMSPEAVSRMRSFDAVYEHSGPLFLAYKGEGFGLGLYSSSHGEFVSSDSGGEPSEGPKVRFRHDFDMGGIAGVAFNLHINRERKTKFMIGGNFKYLVRVRHEADAVPISEAEGFVNPFDFAGDFTIGQAIGSDLAATWKTPNFSLGFVAYDWFGTTLSWTAYSGSFDKLDEKLADTHIHPSLGLGAAWTPDSLFGISPLVLSDVQFALDMRLHVNEPVSFVEMLHAGFESTLLHFLTMRVGVNAGNFACGLGIILANTLYIDYALSTEERGVFSDIRKDPPQLHTLSLTILL